MAGLNVIYIWMMILMMCLSIESKSTNRDIRKYTLSQYNFGVHFSVLSFTLSFSPSLHTFPSLACFRVKKNSD